MAVQPCFYHVCKCRNVTWYKLSETLFDTWCACNRVVVWCAVSVDLISLISEIMLYFMIVASTLCLAVTFVVCYKQVEQADAAKRGNV